MAYSLRNFKKEDAGGVKDLIIAILAREYPFDRKAYADTDLDKIGEVYGGERDSFFVIEENGNIVGTVGIKCEGPEEALLRRLFVESGHRKRGYGSQLLKTAIRFCKDKGYKKMYFRCTDRMVDAMRLCEKEGFAKKESLEVSGFNIHKLELSI